MAVCKFRIKLEHRRIVLVIFVFIKRNQSLSLSNCRWGTCLRSLFMWGSWSLCTPHCKDGTQSFRMPRHVW